jgi:hypothetical protein
MKETGRRDLLTCYVYILKYTLFKVILVQAVVVIQLT